LASGEKVTVTVMEPHIERMRRFDLIPLKIIQSILKIVPGIECERKVVDQIVNRLTYNLGKELNAKLTILGSVGFDLSQPPEQLRRDSRFIPLSLYVPPPIVDLCSEHVLVSCPAGTKIKKLKPRHARALISGCTDLIFQHSLIISDITRRNVRRVGDRVSLNRFGSLVKFDPVQLTAALRLGIGIAAGSRWLSEGPAQVLGLDTRRVNQMVNRQAFDLNTIRRVVGQNAEFLLGFGEAACGMWSATRESAGSPLMMAPLLTGITGQLCR
jgi:hypothetical protein